MPELHMTEKWHWPQVRRYRDCVWVVLFGPLMVLI